MLRNISNKIRATFRNVKYFEWINTCVLLLTLILAISTFSIADHLNKLNYSPQLVVTKFQLLDIKKTATNGSQQPSFVTNALITLKNIGNNNAHLMLQESIAQSTGDCLFRKEKRDKEFAEEVKNAPSGYYADRQLYPNQENIIPVTFENLNSFDSIITLHFFIIYKNDNGIIYDTYYWYSGKIIESSDSVSFNFLQDNNSFHIFSKRESRTIRRIYEKNVANKKYSVVK